MSEHSHIEEFQSGSRLAGDVAKNVAEDVTCES